MPRSDRYANHPERALFCAFATIVGFAQSSRVQGSVACVLHLPPEQATPRFLGSSRSGYLNCAPEIAVFVPKGEACAGAAARRSGRRGT